MSATQRTTPSQRARTLATPVSPHNLKAEEDDVDRFLGSYAGGKRLTSREQVLVKFIALSLYEETNLLDFCKTLGGALRKHREWPDSQEGATHFGEALHDMIGDPENQGCE